MVRGILNSDIYYLILSFILISISFTLVFNNELLLTGRPLTEDAYYSFTVARNIALGNGITTGDGIMTNGFQPLFTFLLSIPYLLIGGDKILSLRIILFIQWIIYLLTSIIVGKIGKIFFDNIPGNKYFTGNVSLLITYLYLSCVSIFLIHFNGLETGLLLLFYSVLGYLYQKKFINNYINLFIYSILLGLLVLTRIDTVFFVILFTVLQFFEFEYNLKKRFFRFLMVSITSFCITLPWWLYNYVCFGSFIPSSGIAQQSMLFDLSRIETTLIAITQNLMPLVYLGAATLEGWASNLFRIILIVILLSFAIKIFKENKNCIFKNEICIRTIVFFGTVLLSMLILVIYYTISFYSTWFYFRYYAPILLVSILVIGIVIQYIINKIPMLKISLVLLLIPVTFSVYLISRGSYLNEYYIHQLELVKNFVPEKEFVGAFQSGTLGYFYDNTINLDGKTNPDAIKYKSHLLKYVERKNINYLCDWKWKLDNLLKNGQSMSEKGWINVAESGKFRLIKKTAY